MPTRSYYFPHDFKHLEEILRAEPEGLPDEVCEHFRSRGLPPITSEGALPRFLGISPKTIYSIRLNSRKHYRKFDLKKRDGTVREIHSPRTYLKVIQWWLLDNLLNRVKLADNVFGFVAGRSAVQNALYHRGSTHLLNVDIQQFFPSITQEQVEHIFGRLGYDPSVAKMLADLCCMDRRVPQGAPTSPALANLVLEDLDRDLGQLAERFACRYSRYADDLTFSSHARIDEALLAEVSATVQKAGFQLKEAKTRFAGRGDRMEVTGVVINDLLQPPRTWRKKTRATLHKMGLRNRLTRADIYYLYGVRGMAAQYEASQHMQALRVAAEELLKAKSHTVIGFGAKPSLPNGLTLRQAKALAELGPRRTNSEIAAKLETTEAAIKKRLQEAYRKLGVADRAEAERWAKKNL